MCPLLPENLQKTKRLKIIWMEGSEKMFGWKKKGIYLIVRLMDTLTITLMLFIKFSFVVV